MKKLLLILLLFIAFGSFAQQGLQMEFTEQDSVQMRLQRQMEYQQFISGASNFLAEDIKLPDINFQEEFLKRYSLNLNFSPVTNYSFVGFSSGMMSPYHSPLFRNGKVLSAAAYQLSDKFTLGGYSYGTNSIFSSPLPNQGINKFDSYGSTLFMEYKVSKNFKIETRINVQQRGQHPGF
ncbi:MAG: hypothetical protein HQ522_09025 [Bacteroidetes bacterium]|nr:hypothetical protein [Bacteroidota bacterium]